MTFFDLFRREHSPLNKQAFDEMQNMLKIGKEMFAAATGYTLDNKSLDLDLNTVDNEVNRGEQQLRRDVLTHLTIDPKRELVFSLKLLSIVHEAERIGDLAKTIAVIGSLAKEPRTGTFIQQLRTVRDQILVIFEMVEECFREEDEKGAASLMDKHETVKAELTQYIQNLAQYDDITPNEGIVYALCARSMSRVSSHLANIASTVVSPFELLRRSSTWK